jgi:hypothetical protein
MISSPSATRGRSMEGAGVTRSSRRALVRRAHLRLGPRSLLGQIGLTVSVVVAGVLIPSAKMAGAAPRGHDSGLHTLSECVGKDQGEFAGTHILCGSISTGKGVELQRVGNVRYTGEICPGNTDPLSDIKESSDTWFCYRRALVSNTMHFEYNIWAPSLDGVYRQSLYYVSADADTAGANHIYCDIHLRETGAIANDYAPFVCKASFFENHGVTTLNPQPQFAIEARS